VNIATLVGHGNLRLCVLGMEHGIPGMRNMVLKAGYENIMVSYTASDHRRGVEGLRLTEIAREWHTEPFDVVVRLLLDEDFAVGMITWDLCDSTYVVGATAGTIWQHKAPASLLHIR
jgi:N-acyl-D-aspartate/D-glutamate deacylase